MVASPTTRGRPLSTVLTARLPRSLRLLSCCARFYRPRGRLWSLLCLRRIDLQTLLCRFFNNASNVLGGKLWALHIHANMHFIRDLNACRRLFVAKDPSNEHRKRRQQQRYERVQLSSRLRNCVAQVPKLGCTPLDAPGNRVVVRDARVLLRLESLSKELQSFSGQTRPRNPLHRHLYTVVDPVHDRRATGAAWTRSLTVLETDVSADNGHLEPEHVPTAVAYRGNNKHPSRL